MRCYQHQGLTEKAEAFLDENVVTVPEVVCPKCGEVISEKRKILETVLDDVFYGDGPVLNTYELKDGRVCREVVQAMPWSSGPMGFICLEIDGKKKFKWPAKAIDHC